MTKLDKQNILAVAALLIHAAKIDENYSEEEKKLVLRFIEKVSDSKDGINEILKEAEKIETNSNQLLNFTKVIKEQSLDLKKVIIENLWEIIISDKKIDQYESNLMRRICGLIYFPDKLNGEIKLRILNQWPI